jgi:hypothetical protein
MQSYSDAPVHGTLKTPDLNSSRALDCVCVSQYITVYVKAYVFRQESIRQSILNLVVISSRTL